MFAFGDGAMAPRPIRILLQTTIPYVEDDWNVGRFSLLADHLASAHLEDGTRFDVTTRDLERDATGADPVLSSLAGSSYDELWLFAVDAGDGLRPAECAGVEAFRRRGGGLLAMRDHQDLGCSLCALSGVGAANHFHTKNLDPSEENRCADDCENRTIDWPNYHSGSNGDVQRIRAVDPTHPLLRVGPGRLVTFLPAHPHEGDVGPAEGDDGGHVIAVGCSQTTGREFNLIVVRDGSGSREGPRPGRWIAESSFHHVADYNWDTRKGAPSFVSEPPGDQIATSPSLLDDVHAYVTNATRWLAQPPF
jgi:hypothetical protein